MSSFLIEEDIDISSLLLAYEQFKNGLATAQSPLEKTGTIKLFEITFELSWKTMRRILLKRGKDVNSPKAIIREAAKEKLIENPEPWFEFIDERNETIHTYNRNIAEEIFSKLSEFDSEVKKFITHIKKQNS